MPLISHQPDRFQLINLRLNKDGKGPFMIRQEGYPPGSTNMANHRYFLLKDGSWMLNYAFFLLDEKEQEEHFLPELEDVFEAIDKLAGKRVVVHDKLPEGSTKESILRGVRETGSHLLRRLHEAHGHEIERP